MKKDQFESLLSSGRRLLAQAIAMPNRSDALRGNINLWIRSLRVRDDFKVESRRYQNFRSLVWGGERNA